MPLTHKFAHTVSHNSHNSRFAWVSSVMDSLHKGLNDVKEISWECLCCATGSQQWTWLVICSCFCVHLFHPRTWTPFFRQMPHFLPTYELDSVLLCCVLLRVKVANLWVCRCHQLLLHSAVMHPHSFKRQILLLMQFCLFELLSGRNKWGSLKWK